MQDTIHIIEPTLIDQDGHCYSFVNSLVRLNQKHRIVIWAGRGAKVDFRDSSNTELKNYFYRKIRKLQFPLLLYWLLKKNEKIFISTATRLDLLILKIIGSSKIPRNKIYLYFHWFRVSEKKRAQLHSLANSLSNINILVPTDSLKEMFIESGFSSVRLVPYPITPRRSGESRYGISFSHILYAGAARMDKGFLSIVKLVQELETLHETIPIKIQISSDHGKRHENRIQEAIHKLKVSKYENLQLFPAALNTDEYMGLFHGGIALQLYKKNDFKDRISGITLDAFSQGCPIICTADTWTAKNVAKYQAGVVLKDIGVDSIYRAIKMIIQNYSKYSENAFKGGSELQIENDAAFLFSTILE